MIHFKSIKKLSYKSHLIKLLFIFVYAIILPSCVNLPSYPEDWSPLNEATKNNNCPSIAGRYIEPGLSSKENRPEKLPLYITILRKYLARGIPMEYQYQRTMANDNMLFKILQKDKEKLEIRVKRRSKDSTFTGEMQWKFDKDRQDFDCNDGWVNFKKFPAWVPFIGIAWEDVFLKKNQKGELIMKRKSGLITMYWLPFVFIRDDWIRWKTEPENTVSNGNVE